jgi:hypothetical protein
VVKGLGRPPTRGELGSDAAGWFGRSGRHDDESVVLTDEAYRFLTSRYALTEESPINYHLNRIHEAQARGARRAEEVRVINGALNQLRARGALPAGHLPRVVTTAWGSMLV